MGKKIIIAVYFALIIFCLVGLSYLSNSESANLTPELTVLISDKTAQITGPKVLLERTSGIVGRNMCGISVDYGDGTRTPLLGGHSCMGLMTHTYEKSGKYNILVTGFHPSPTDASIEDLRLKTQAEIK